MQTAASSVRLPDPPDLDKPTPETVIWRYMDFSRFMGLLQHKSIRFNRSDLFEDLFEGRHPEQFVKRQLERARQMADRNFRSGTVSDERLLKLLQDTAELERKCAYVSSWHENEFESEAMWKLYGSSSGGIAIRTTVGKLMQSFAAHHVTVARVEYVDFSSVEIPDEEIFRPRTYIRKRPSFSHELEVRAFTLKALGSETLEQRLATVADALETHMFELFAKAIVLFPGASLLVDNKIVFEPPPGITTPFNLSRDSDEIVISPYAPPWWHELVVGILETYEVNIPVRRSDLLSPP